MSFAEKILNFRIDNRLSQAETAKIIGVRQSEVSNYESGKHKPTKLNEVYMKRKMQEYERSKNNV